VSNNSGKIYLYCILCLYCVVSALVIVFSVVAIALAEQKLTMEHLHKLAVEELQKKLTDKEVAYTELHRKLTHEKEIAVAETKKKQWVLLPFIDVYNVGSISYHYLGLFFHACHRLMRLCLLFGI